MPRLLKTKPYAYQCNGTKFALEKESVALFMEQGTGKTLVLLFLLARLRLRGLRLAMVVCPKTVVSVWRRQARLHLNIPHVVITSPSQIPEALKGDRLVILAINYEWCWRIVKELKRWPWELIAADEAHKLRNRTSRQSKALWKLGEGVPRRLALTGTPIGRDELDLFGIFRFIDPSLLGDNWKLFARRYLRRAGYMGYKWKVRKNKREELLALLEPITFRVKDDASDRPRVTNHEIHVPLEAKVRGLYDALEKDYVVRLEGHNFIKTPLAITNLLRLQQLAGGFLVDDEDVATLVSKAKLDATIDYVEGINPKRKVVIFCRFRHEIEELERRVKKLGRTVATLHGGTKNKRIWEAFQDKKDPNVFIVQIATGGVGIDLFAANYCIFYSTTQGFIDYAQARKRVDRKGQTRPVTFVHVLGENTVDEDFLSSLDARGETAEEVLSHFQKRTRSNPTWPLKRKPQRRPQRRTTSRSSRSPSSASKPSPSNSMSKKRPSA